MLTLYEFNNLSGPEKEDTIWKGTYIDNRVENELIIQLYKFDTFYVEVYYDQLNNKIIKFRAFNAISQLGPYLKKQAFKF